MTPSLRQFLDNLHANGAAHDAAEPDRLLKYRNLEPATAELLSLIVRMAGARRVVEIGTANGYSTTVLADAVADIDGHLLTVDTASQDEARANLARADAVRPGLATRVEFLHEDGGAVLAGRADESVALLFLDAERVEYPGWWPHPVRVLRRGGVLAIDNVLSHPDEVAPFLALLSAERAVEGSTFAVGKGLHLAWRRAGNQHQTNHQTNSIEATSPASNPNAAIRNERVLSARAPAIFAAFTQADRLSQWWGPKGFTNTFELFEFKPGGRWVFVMHGPNGGNYANECVFREIVPDSRIVIDHVVKPLYSLAVILTARGEQTHVAWIQEFDSPEMAARMRPLAEPGNEENLDRLEAFLARERS